MKSIDGQYEDLYVINKSKFYSFAYPITNEAQAKEYEQLGYFSAAIKAEDVLKNVQSTSGEKSDSLIQITIEGDLP